MKLFTHNTVSSTIHSGIKALCCAAIGWSTINTVHAAAPQITAPPVLNATVGTTYTYDLNATDADNDTLSYSVSTWPSGLDVSMSDQGVVTWELDDRNDAGQYNISVRVKDNDAGEDTLRYKLTVTDPNNHIPVINNAPLLIGTVGTTYRYDLNATDADNDTLRYSVSTWPTGLEVNVSDQGLVSWMLDDHNDAGHYTIIARVDDNNLGVATQRYTLTVTDPSNAAPVINNAPVLSGTVGTLYTYALNATDANNDTLTYAVSTWPRGLDVDMSEQGVISWALDDTDDAGKYIVTARVYDGNLGVDVLTYRLTINDPNNHVPVINNAPILTGTVGSTYTYDLNATDADNDALRYSVSTWPYGLDVSVSAQGVLSWNLDEHDDAGVYTIIARVDDDNQGVDSVRYKLTVTDPNNHAPVITNEPVLTTSVDSTYAYHLNATDADNDTLRYSVSTWPNALEVTVSAQGVVNWVLDSSVNVGDYRINVTADDGNLGVDTRSYKLTVIAAEINLDRDGDGIANADDAFPDDPLQSADSNGDGTGDNTVTTQGVSYTYNDNGQILTVNGPRTDVNDITTYTYDSDGNRDSITDAMGNTTTLSNYNGRGQPQQLTDANGTITTLNYHLRGWLLSSTIQHFYNIEPLASTTSYTYDNVGNVTLVTLPADHQLNQVQLTYHYDTSNRLIAVSNTAGERIDYTLDNASNRTAQTISDSGSAITYRMTQAFDELSRVMEIVGADDQTTQIDYDVNDNPVQTINPRSYASQNQYDPLDRLTQTTDADNGTTQFTYDDQDRLTSVTDANGNSTTYQYNAFDHLIQQSSPDTGITRYAYDNAGNRVVSVDSRGVVSRYQYDAVNRLTQVSYPLFPEENITYTYDVSTYALPDDETLTVNAKGRLFSLQDPSGQQFYAYDHRGNVSSHIRIIGNEATSPVYWTDYLYDPADNVTQVQMFSNTGGAEALDYAISYRYDNLGRLAGVDYTRDNTGQPSTALVDSLTYLPFGGVTGIDYANGVSSQHSYDQDYRLSQWQTHTDNATLIDRSYSYDANSNITQIDHLTQPVNTQDFAYDPLDRLESSSDQTGDLIWGYDSVGNRLSENTDDYGYQLGSNILLDVQRTTATTSYTLDERGNTTNMSQDGSATRFIYNAANRPQSVSKDGVTTSYLYNALGQRTSKTQGGSTTHYIYTLQGQLMGEYTEGGQAVVEYLYLGNQPLVQLRGAAVYYYHNDHIGTPIAMTDENQNVVWQANYTAFGNAELTVTAVGNNLRFAGQYFDQESGLHYNYFRYYDPKTGRYTQSDPIGLDGGINTYAYVYNNPLRYTDPFGLEAWVNASPNAQGGLNFTAHDNQGGPAITGNFNNDTTNFNQVESGVYNVTPRPTLPNTPTNWLFDRNANAGNPTISNTDDWNTIRYSDGSITTGAQFHEGRNGTSSGTSLACMVSDRGTNDALNEMFNRNYGHGGVTLTIFTSGWAGP
ncbi:MAG: RHS repeat-associated protein [Candidatus Endobugula sp.]|jgi:RHS repeat-associated protein